MSEECPICLNNYPLNHFVKTTCNHVFCRPCIEQCLEYNPKCPICRRTLNRTNLSPLSIESPTQSITFPLNPRFIQIINTLKISISMPVLSIIYMMIYIFPLLLMMGLSFHLKSPVLVLICMISFYHWFRNRHFYRRCLLILIYLLYGSLLIPSSPTETLFSLCILMTGISVAFTHY